MKNSPQRINNPKTTIGHVHLKVSDLERSVQFYTEVIGFEVTTRYGNSAAFLSFPGPSYRRSRTGGGYHHHLGLNAWESRGGKPPAAGTTGLFHFAILVPTRKDLARAVQRLTEHEWPIDGVADHGVSEAIYLRDPDHNGIEIYVDRPRDQWPQGPNGELLMYTHPLDIDGLLAELR